MDADDLGRRTGLVHFDLDGLVSTIIDDKGPVCSVQLGIQLNSQLLIGRAREHEFGALDQLAEHGKRRILEGGITCSSCPAIDGISHRTLSLMGLAKRRNTMNEEPALQLRTDQC